MESESNWKATHQLGSKIWFIGGLIITAIKLLLNGVPALAAISGLNIMTLIPAIFSFVYYKKHTVK